MFHWKHIKKKNNRNHTTKTNLTDGSLKKKSENEIHQFEEEAGCVLELVQGVLVRGERGNHL